MQMVTDISIVLLELQISTDYILTGELMVVTAPVQAALGA